MAPAGSSAIPNGRSAVFLRRRSRPINPSALATELDRTVAAALKATAGSSGPLYDTVNRLNISHKALKAQRASGLLTDEEYAKEAGGLLNILSNFDGLIAEVAMGDHN